MDSFLHENARRSGVKRKIGLYTSPSLWPRNRIRIDSNPLSEELFAKRVFEVYNGLSLGSGTLAPGAKTPGFLQMMAIVSFHTFIKEGVKVVICEAHHGGQFDATNFIDRPVITAITKIGMDHVENLGGSIRNIAWHKSGIFKQGALALSVPQVPEAEDEIRRRAGEKGVELTPFVQVGDLKGVPLEQRENFTLATQIAYRFLERSGHLLDGRDVEVGIKACYWPGRFEIVNHGNLTWYLDGAHNETSMEVVAKWYDRVAKARYVFDAMFDEKSNKMTGSSPRALIFAHFSPKRTRDWTKILGTLGKCLRAPIHHAIFVNRIEFDDHFATPEEWLEDYAQFWRDNWAPGSIHMVDRVGDGIEQALDLAKENGKGAQVLVTGSLYLVEAALELVKNIST